MPHTRCVNAGVRGVSFIVIIVIYERELTHDGYAIKTSHTL